MTAELVRIPVPGTDREIVAAMVDGKPQVSLRHACDAIGIAVESQRAKLRRRSWACTTPWVAQMPGDDQARERGMAGWRRDRRPPGLGAA